MNDRPVGAEHAAHFAMHGDKVSIFKRSLCLVSLAGELLCVFLHFGKERLAEEAILKKSIASVSFVQNLKTRKAEVEQKIDRLLDIYIEGKGISLDEFQVKKAKLLGEKADIEQEIRDFEQKGNNWLEPMREVIY